jgi:hypothetical protein
MRPKYNFLSNFLALAMMRLALAEYATILEQEGKELRQRYVYYHARGLSQPLSRRLLDSDHLLKTLCHFKIVAPTAAPTSSRISSGLVSSLFARRKRQSTSTSQPVYSRSPDQISASRRTFLKSHRHRDEIRNPCVDLLSGREELLR